MRSHAELAARRGPCFATGAMRRACLAFTAALCACAHAGLPAPAPEAMEATPLATEASMPVVVRAPEVTPRDRVLDAAHALLERGYGGDCSGFVLEVFRDAGVRLEPAAPSRTGSEALYRATRHVRRPRPGDIAFFHDTYDRNHDGRADDRFTHVALVEAVDGSRVTLIHKGNHGVGRIVLDLARRHDAGVNSVLREPRRGDPRRARYLAGELLSGFGRALP